MADKRLALQIRTPSNEPHDFEASDDEFVVTLALRATEYFVSQHQLAPGDYGLSLLEDGTAKRLPDDARLDEAGVKNQDVLVLHAKKPKVDG